MNLWLSMQGHLYSLFYRTEWGGFEPHIALDTQGSLTIYLYDIESRILWGWLLSIPRNYENMLLILKGNPFIQIRNDEPWISIFTEDIGAIGETKLKKEARKHAIKGICRLQVLDTKGDLVSLPIGS